MAPVSLNVSALWRPWRQAGLPHLLLEAETVSAINDALTARRIALVASARQAPPRHLDAPSTSVPPPALSVDSAPVLASSVPLSSVSPKSAPLRAPDRGANGPSLSAPSASKQGEVSPSGAPQGEARQNPQVVTPSLAPLPLAQWPKAWVERLRKTPPTPRIVWTYAELSSDLAGLGEASRGVFFRALFGELGMEPGSQALWPLNMPPHAGVDALFFVSGVEALQPATVVFMGDAEPDMLDFPRIAPFCSDLWRGRRFVRLHSVDALRADTQSRHNQLISQIKSFHRTL